MGNAELDLGQFEFAGDQRSAVNGCLRTASGLEKVPEIIKAALRDNPDHGGLKGLSDKFELDRPLADNIAESAKNLSGFRVLLRRSRHLTRDELNRFDAKVSVHPGCAQCTTRRPRPGSAPAVGRWPDTELTLNGAGPH